MLVRGSLILVQIITALLATIQIRNWMLQSLSPDLRSNSVASSSFKLEKVTGREYNGDLVIFAKIQKSGTTTMENYLLELRNFKGFGWQSSRNGPTSFIYDQPKVGTSNKRHEIALFKANRNIPKISQHPARFSSFQADKCFVNQV